MKRLLCILALTLTLGGGVTGCAFFGSFVPPKPETIEQGVFFAKAFITLANERLAVAVERKLIPATQARTVQTHILEATAGVRSSEQLLTQGAPLDAEHALNKALEALELANDLIDQYMPALVTPDGEVE